MEITGRIAVVTGGGAGIGQAISRRLAAEGASVLVVELDPDAGCSTVDEIGSAGGRAALAVADVSTDRGVLGVTSINSAGPVQLASGGRFVRFMTGGYNHERMRINELGQVGIGTSEPGRARLRIHAMDDPDVESGDDDYAIYAEGNVKVDGWTQTCVLQITGGCELR